MYAYYKRVVDAEHYLLQKEIAEISGFVSGNNNPHTQLVGAALKNYVEVNKLESFFYFSTAYKSLLNVYPKSIYKPVLEMLYEKIGDNAKGSIEIAGKKYSYGLIHKAIFGGAI